MKFELQRYEKSLDHDGKVKNIFISVLVTDDSGNTKLKEHFLTEAQMASVLSNESNLNAILEEQAAIGDKELEEQLAAVPQPPVVANKTKLDSFVINKTNVAAKKAELED